nr:MAG TPA: chromosome segregation protein [Caudoviricetes sp.]
MSINVKKYTKDQMAKMVEDAQEKSTALEKEVVELKNCIDAKNDLLAEYAKLKAEMQRKNVVLTEQIDQMNGEAINKANEIESLKANLDSSKNSVQYLNDQGQQYWRAWQASKREIADLKNKLNDTEAALGRANDECAFKQEALNVMRNRRYKAEQRANYAESHPWRNLWAWIKRKLGGERNEHVS